MRVCNELEAVMEYKSYISMNIITDKLLSLTLRPKQNRQAFHHHYLCVF